MGHLTGRQYTCGHRLPGRLCRYRFDGERVKRVAPEDDVR